MLKSFDVEELLRKNPQVDAQEIREFLKTIKQNEYRPRNFWPSPYGLRRPRPVDPGWKL